MIRIIKNRMKSLGKSIPLLFLIFWSAATLGSPVNSDSLRFEVLLTNKMLNDLHINGKIIPAIDISSDRLVVLSTADQLYLLGWGGMIPLGNKTTGAIQAFAFTPDNVLMTIRGKELCVLDSLGDLHTLFKLPREGMGINAGKYVMYLYERDNARNKNAVYLLSEGGKYTKLIELPGPVAQVTEMNNSILFTNENGLFSLDLRSKEFKVLTSLPKGKKIISIATDPATNRIYFSTEDKVYALKDKGAVVISDKSGGLLRFFNNGLVVFNPEKKVLVRISGIENEITSAKKEIKPVVTEPRKPDTITNNRVIDMVKAELSDDLIIKIINSSPVNFDLSVDAMISLSNQKVSSAVIKAMKNVMKKKTGADK